MLQTSSGHIKLKAKVWNIIIHNHNTEYNYRAKNSDKLADKYKNKEIKII